jgi:uncharacterized membrane protein YtjA (UPF0391 family)
MKLLISIIVGILGFATITALAAAVIAVVFSVHYTDVVHFPVFMMLALFAILPASVSCAQETDEIITNYFNK